MHKIILSSLALALLTGCVAAYPADDRRGDYSYYNNDYNYHHRHYYGRNDYYGYSRPHDRDGGADHRDNGWHGNGNERH
jgi:hypothetical protein